jgi:hypothetical protein
MTLGIEKMFAPGAEQLRAIAQYSDKLMDHMSAAWTGNICDVLLIGRRHGFDYMRPSESELLQIISRFLYPGRTPPKRKPSRVRAGFEPSP